MTSTRDASAVRESDVRADGVPHAVHRDGLLGPAVRQVLTHPATHLLPPLAGYTVGALGLVVLTVVSASVLPTVLLDGTFRSVGTSSALLVLAGVLVLASLWCGAGAAGIVTFAATARELGRVPHLPDVRRGAARRRWFLLGCALLAVVVLGVPVAGFAWLLVGRLGLPVWAAGVAAVTWVVVVSPVAALPTVALMGDVGLLAAWRRARALRRVDDVDASYRRGLRRVLGSAAAAVVAAWTVVHHATGLPFVDDGPWSDSEPWLSGVARPLRDGLGTGVLVVVGTMVSAVAVAGVVRVVLRTSTLVPDVARRHVREPSALLLPGADGVASPGDVRRVRVVGAAVVAMVVVAPPLLVAANPTGALEPRVDTVGALGLHPLLLALDDGVLVVNRGTRADVEQTWCAGDAACTTAHPSEELAYWQPVAAAPDPTGDGAVVLGTAVVAEDKVLVAATCGPDVCERATPDDVVVLGPSLAPAQVSTAHGTYAFLLATAKDEARTGSSEELTLVRCSTLACADRTDVVVAVAGSGHQVQLEVASDGTAVVLLADPNGPAGDGSDGSVRVLAVPPDATAPVELTRLEAVPGHTSLPEHATALPTFRLALRDDGAPIVLRAGTASGFWLTSCGDAACDEQVTRELDIDPALAHDVDLAVDATGRPLVATAAHGAGVRLHACVDESCRATREGLVWPGSAPTQLRTRSGAEYLELDREGRPVLLVSGGGLEHVVRCPEVRCGL